MQYQPIPHRLFAAHDAARPADPDGLWRRLCWVTDRLAISGDLHPSRTAALGQLRDWVAAGITDVMDMRCEASDASFVAEHVPEIRYHWLGVDDEGGPRESSWFEGIARVSADILAEPGRKVLVHCHMGINRGPSAAYAALLVAGGDPVETLDAIRTARPIASAMYSLDAIQWWADRTGMSPTEAAAAHAAVLTWHREHPLDVPYCISRIGNRYAA
jgi:hypothetical protein